MSHFGAVVALGFLVASAIMNYLFGFSLGRTELEGRVYGIVGVLAVFSNALCPFFAYYAHQAKRWPTVYAITLFWLLCLAYSLTSALGFAADNRQSITTPKAALHDVLKSKEQTLADLEAKKRTPKLETRIHSLRDEINALRLKGASSEPDPQSTFLSSVTFGLLNQQDIKLALLILFSVMVELGAAIGLFAALTTQPQKPKRAPPKQKTNGVDKKKPLWSPKKPGAADMQLPQ